MSRNFVIFTSKKDFVFDLFLNNILKDLEDWNVKTIRQNRDRAILIIRSTSSYLLNKITRFLIETHTVEHYKKL